MRDGLSGRPWRRGRRRHRTNRWGRLDAVHLAVALEYDAFVDEQRRRDDVAVHARGRMQLDRSLGANVAMDASLDDDDADLDFGLHLGALADDQDVVGEDLAAKLAIDANGPLEG